jgi:hypothetical protein
MIRTFKWIYNLGVEQERLRVARLLEAEAHSRSVVATTGLDMLRDVDNKMSKDRKQRLDFDSAVAREVGEIVANIIKPREEWVASPSPLFDEATLTSKKER